ncbi:hypothetical protein BD0136_06690 [Helicobacter pylori]
MKLFSLMQSTTKSPKKALSKRLSLELGFPLTKNAKKDFASNPPPKNLKIKKRVEKSEKRKRSNPKKKRKF